MKPIEFEGNNTLYTKPEGMSDEECGSLPTHQEGNSIISCWELSEEDLKKVLVEKKIWLGVLSPVQPPVFLSAQEPLQVTISRKKRAENG